MADLIEVWVLFSWGWKRVAFCHTKKEAFDFTREYFRKEYVDLVGSRDKLLS